ncbi:MAG: YraN family protein [Deltaproteobacteria bacterium]|nr:YraN family protein [Deltaproteobacteria bacterium]
MQADSRRHRHGKKGEDGAATYLAKQGWTVIDRNARFPVGEIDLVATRGKELWFFEVKTRGPESLIPAREALQPRQLKRLRRAAEWYIVHKGPAWEEYPVSFGFLAVELDASGSIDEIELIEETL